MTAGPKDRPGADETDPHPQPHRLSVGRGAHMGAWPRGSVRFALRSREFTQRPVQHVFTSRPHLDQVTGDGATVGEGDGRSLGKRTKGQRSRDRVAKDGSALFRLRTNGEEEDVPGLGPGSAGRRSSNPSADSEPLCLPRRPRRVGAGRGHRPWTEGGR